MSYKLFVNYSCPYALRSIIVDACKNANIEKVVISLSDMPEWYKKLNNRETVPAIQLPDGRVFSESMLICRYIDEHFEPKNELFSTHPEARYAIQNFIEATSSANSVFYKACRATESEKEAEIVNVNNRFKAVADLMDPVGPFALGPKFTMADIAFLPFCYLTATCLTSFLGYNVLEKFPRLQKFLDACFLIRGVASVLPPQHTLIAGAYRLLAPLVPKWEYTFYHVYGSPYCARVDLALSRITAKCQDFVKFNRVKVDLMNPPEWFLTLNPAGLVPVLKTPQGKVLTESALIMQYLSDSFPEAKLDPEEEDVKLEGRILLDLIDICTSAVKEIVFTFKQQHDVPLPDDAKWAIQEIEKIYARKSGPYLTGNEACIYDMELLPALYVLDVVFKPETDFTAAPHVRKLLDTALNDTLYMNELKHIKNIFQAK